MSIFFNDIDDTGVAFGVQSCNVPEVVIFSSTGDDARMCLFTNNYIPIDNIYTGSTIGTSNYGRTKQNEIYLGHISGQSNVTKVLVVHESNVGINTAQPTAALHVSPGLTSNVFVVASASSASAAAAGSTAVPQAFVVNVSGEVGINTSPSPVAMLSVSGGVLADVLSVATIQSVVGAAPINFANSSLSNVGVASISNVMVTSVSPGPMASAIDLLGDVVVASSHTLYAGSVASAPAPGGGQAPPGVINFNMSTLCNVAGLEISTLTSPTGVLSFGGNSLSNITNASISNAVVTNLVQAPGAPSINMLGHVALPAPYTLYTNSVAPVTNAGSIDFNMASLNNIGHLAVNGDLNVTGQFIITDTDTQSTTQMYIENAGTCTALVVNQLGTLSTATSIVEFMNNSNVVMSINNDGQTVFGSSASSTANAHQQALVNITNPWASNQTALDIRQDSSTNPVLALHTANDSNHIVFGPSHFMTIMSCNVLSAPHETPSQTAFMVASTGQVGIGTNPLGCNATLVVNGTIMAQNIQIGAGVSLGSAITTTAINTPDGTSYLGFGGAGLCNIQQILASNIATTVLGSAITPAYAFTVPTGVSSAGSFGPSSDQFAVATAGMERLRVDSAGRVGISTMFPQYTLDVAGTVNAVLFNGNGAGLSNIPGSSIVSAISSNILPVSTTTETGITQLTDGVESQSTTTAATANAAYLANSNAESRVSKAGDTMFGPLTVTDTVVAATFEGNGTNLTNLNASALTSGTVDTSVLPSATTTDAGITQLTDGVSSQSTTTASTANAVYLANANAESRVSKAGDTMSGPLTVTDTVVADAFEGNGSNLTDLNASALTTGTVATSVLPSATTTDAGITQLTDGVASQSTTTASTANAAYLANANAESRVSKDGDTMSGPLTVNATVTANAFTGDGSNLTDLNASALTTGTVAIALLPSASTTDVGITQLTDGVSSQSTTTAATANAAYLANSNAETRVSKAGDTMSGPLTVTAMVAANVFVGNGSNLTDLNASALTSGTVDTSLLPSATTTDVGITQLTDGVSSQSTTTAATANAAYLANSNAECRVSKAGDTMSGPLTVTAMVAANVFVGNGSNLTDLSASALTTGTVSTSVLPTASTSTFGITQLTDGVSSQSTTSASTANAAYLANSNAESRVSKDGDTMSGPLTVNASVIAAAFEGDGSNITDLNASALTSGTVSTTVLPTASTTNTGITQLTDGVASQSTTTAATANAAYLANSNADNRVSKDGDSMTGPLIVTATVFADAFVGDGSSLTNLDAAAITTGSFNASLLPQASLTQAGIVQLEDSVMSTSTTKAATPNSVYLAYENANSRVMRNGGDILTGAFSIYGDLNLYKSNGPQSTDGNLVVGGDLTVYGATVFESSLVLAGGVIVNTITTPSPEGIINMSGTTLSNVGSIVVPSISSPTDTISMNFSKVLDIDTLIVRSNITVTLPGLNTYTNLPTDLVHLDAATGYILDSYISSNIARLMSDGTLNPALLPIQQAPRSTFLRTTDRVGIGIRCPGQRLHVNNGNACVTGGRLAVGTSNMPLGALHVWDDNSGVPSVRIDNLGSYDTLRVNGPGTTPLMYITANCNVGIWTAIPQYPLDVHGTARTLQLRTNTMTSDNGVIDFTQTSLSNVGDATINTLEVYDSITAPVFTVVDTLYTDVLTSTNRNIQVASAMHITGFDSTLYSGPTPPLPQCNVIGLRVEKNVMAQGFLSTSDRRAKTRIVPSDPDADLMTLLSTPVHRFNFKDRPRDSPTLGFIAQEVEATLPCAIKTTTNAVPSIMREGLLDGRTRTLTLVGDDDANAGAANDVHVGDKIQFISATTNRTYVREILGIIGNKWVLDAALFTVFDSDRDREHDLPGSDNEPIPVFVYGRVVDDFKLIDNDRMVPLVFNSVKAMYSRLTKLEQKMEEVLRRVA